MKRIIILSALLFTGLLCSADYNGSVTTSSGDLTYSTIGNYDIVSIPNGFYTEEIGAPQLPVKIISIVIPVDKKVNDIIINSTSVQQLTGTFNIYPVQTPVPTNLSPDAFPFDNPSPAIVIYPNPTTGKLTIEGENIENIEILNVKGQRIKEFTVNSSQFTIDLSKEAKGIYFVKVRTEKVIAVERIVLK